MARTAEQIRDQADTLDAVATEVRDHAERKACWAVILLGVAGLVALRARARREEAFDALLEEREAERVAGGPTQNGSSPAPAAADVEVPVEEEAEQLRELGRAFIAGVTAPRIDLPDRPPEHQADDDVDQAAAD